MNQKIINCVVSNEYSVVTGQYSQVYCKYYQHTGQFLLLSGEDKIFPSRFQKNIQYFNFGTTIHFYDNVILFLNQSDVDFIKKSKYITDRILGVIF